MTDKFTKINEGLTQQLERDSMIDIPSFRPLLPDMDLKITAGKDNPIYNILQQYYITFDNLNIEANTSPEKGFFLDADLFNLRKSLRIHCDVSCHFRKNIAAAHLLSRITVRKQDIVYGNII